MKHIFGSAMIFVSVAISSPVFADAPQKPPAFIGTINYFEGQASIDNSPLTNGDIGSVVLTPNEILTTQAGKVEILLTPGVFARVGDHSSIAMVSPTLTNTQVSVEAGKMIVEVAEIHPENRVLVNEHGATVQLEKTGLYEFAAQFRVFEGLALVKVAGAQLQIKAGREVDLNDSQLKSRKFDKKEEESTDDLYRWSTLRSAYVAEANVDEAPEYVQSLDSGWSDWYGGWIGTGWYWNPWFHCYTFIPRDGILYSPFGWGFYSPGSEYLAPIYLGGHYYHRFGTESYPWERGMHYAPNLAGGGFGNGFRASSGMRANTRGKRFGFLGSRGRGLYGGGFRGHGGVHSGGFHGTGGGHGGFGGGGHGR